jgi:hypothetical protein
MLNIIETASLGGGTGDSQDKSFLFNTVGPVEMLIMEKFNYRIIKKGMGVTDWKVKLRHADYRNDKDVAEVEDKGIKNGTMSRNEARQEHGRDSIEGGDIATITTGNTLTPVTRLESLEDEQAQQAELSMQDAKTAMQRLQGNNDQEVPDGQDQPETQGNKGKAQPNDQKAKDAGQDQGESNLRGGSETRADLSDIQLEQYLFERRLRRGLCLTLKV